MKRWLLLLLVGIVSIGHIHVVAKESSTPYEILSTLSEDNFVIAVVRARQIMFLLYDQTIIGAEFDDSYLRQQAAFPAFGIMQCVAYLDRQIDRVIQIGLGIGTVPTFLRNKGIVTDVVEISSAVVRQAANYFRYDRCTPEDPNECVHGETFITDGLAFIDAYPPEPTHDVFIIDVYTGSNPVAFFVREVLETIQTKWLKPKGVLVLNFVGFIDGQRADVPKSIYKTLLSLFKIVKCFREMEDGMGEDEAGNIVYYASNEPITFTLPNHDEYANPIQPRTYFYTIKNFEKWEIFQELQEESNVEVEIHQSSDTDDISFDSNQKSHVQILTRADHGQVVFEEIHRHTQEHMRGRVVEQFPDELWEELGLDIE